ncbi:DMT family transporter [Peribacillus frigoritolerans]|jgi:drug/metabolite transporter (DMT)-like permease|uniref:DMT family transporter n=1 Tax=Peribacillus frigoritolerans TaxID=450367 RepID=UPI000BBA2884|nr:DMT family transporter [Peribacillus frigoritolerans]MCP1494831.1 drug/metabolite transporter (DMT)-like permease [Peribacillus frigoritolerans]PCD06769.1 EamA family transporter [Peribacillus simplex]
MSFLKIYILLTGIMITWGLNVSVIKILVAHTQPVTITSLRIFTASLIVIIILFFFGLIRLPKKSELFYVFGGALLSVVFHHYFLAEGLTKTSASNAGLILGMGPILTVILTMIFFRKKPTLIKLLGFICGSLGVSFTVMAGSGGLHSINLGDVDILLSILSQALSFILINKASKTMDPRLLTGYMMLFGSFILFAISLWKEPEGLSSLATAPPSIWGAFFFSAIFATALGHMSYNYAIGKVGAAESSIFLNLNTLFSLLGAAVFLNEALVPAHFIGLIFIVSGVLLGSGAIEIWILQRKNKRLSA